MHAGAGQLPSTKSFELPPILRLAQSVGRDPCRPFGFNHVRSTRFASGRALEASAWEAPGSDRSLSRLLRLSPHAADHHGA